MNLGEEQIELPPGFRFHPSDEELITYYLSPKVANSNFNAIAVGEADLNKSEPWDLPGRAKMGENEWYFFCLNDRKYPTGLRTNRATDSGYWKATGKDKEIYRGRRVVGMKKTLVFYRGRAPKGTKSNWVMHEYRLEGKSPLSDHLPKTTKNEWVICRIFNKSSGEKRTHISDLVRLNPFENASPLPPLMDYSEARVSHMTMEDQQKPQTDVVYNFNTHQFSSSSSSLSAINNHLEAPDSVWMPGKSVLRNLFHNPALKLEFPPISNHGIIYMEDHQHHDPIDLENLWNY